MLAINDCPGLAGFSGEDSTWRKKSAYSVSMLRYTPDYAATERFQYLSTRLTFTPRLTAVIEFFQSVNRQGNADKAWRICCCTPEVCSRVAIYFLRCAWQLNPVAAVKHRCNFAHLATPPPPVSIKMMVKRCVSPHSVPCRRTTFSSGRQTPVRPIPDRAYSESPVID